MISLFRKCSWALRVGGVSMAGVLPLAAGLLLLPVCLPVSAAAWELPQAPSAQMTTGGLRGLVTDTDGALVSGAQVRVLAGGKQHSTMTDTAGRFSLSGLAAGNFELNVSASGLAPASISGSVRAGETTELPPIQLRVATANTDVDVNLPARELAQADVEEEEKQRAFGIVPNFLVSYDRTFTPLDAKQKFSLGWHVVLDPTHFAGAAIAASIQQANDTYPGFGQDAAGYGQRFGASLATTTTATLLRATVFPILFHQDPRYFYRGTGTKLSRAGYALSTAFISKGDNGKWQPAYASIAANFSAAAISNLYYAPSDRKGATLTIDNALIGIGGVAAGHLLQEFLFEKITKHGKHLPPVPPQPAAAAANSPTR